MKLKKKEIINLPVFTQLGQRLGKVVDFEIDTLSHRISVYIVRGGDIFQEIGQKDLNISIDRVVEITNEKMVVEDSVSRLEEKELFKKAAPAS